MDGPSLETVQFHLFWPSSSIPLHRDVFTPLTVNFRRPSTLSLFDQFQSFRPSSLTTTLDLTRKWHLANIAAQWLDQDQISVSQCYHKPLLSLESELYVEKFLILIMTFQFNLNWYLILRNGCNSVNRHRKIHIAKANLKLCQSIHEQVFINS